MANLSKIPRITPADLTIFDWCQACGQEEWNEG